MAYGPITKWPFGKLPPDGQKGVALTDLDDQFLARAAAWCEEHEKQDVALACRAVIRQRQTPGTAPQSAGTAPQSPDRATGAPESVASQTARLQGLLDVHTACFRHAMTLVKGAVPMGEEGPDVLVDVGEAESEALGRAARDTRTAVLCRVLEAVSSLTAQTYISAREAGIAWVAPKAGNAESEDGLPF